ncbi:MAG: septal ring lytic transglycosylase RlpA family protein [Pseudomonadota bacterium]
MSKKNGVSSCAILALAALLLAACSSTPQRKAESGVPAAPAGGGYLAGDGPGADAPANLDAIPDAVPKYEPLHRYANRPYVALGKTYTPLTTTGTYKQRGIASWYGKKFHGQRTSVGEVYDMYAMTAAHPTLPIPSYARVTNLANKKSVVVRVNDRGPFLHDRVIDLSYAAAYKLGIVGDGSAEVEVESLPANVSVKPLAASTVQSQPLESGAPASAVAELPVVAIASLENSDTGVYLQLGAFKTQEAAEVYLAKMRSELSDNGKQLKLTNKDGLVRVHIGPYANQSEARLSAESMESKLGFKPMVNLP